MIKYLEWDCYIVTWQRQDFCRIVQAYHQHNSRQPLLSVIYLIYTPLEEVVNLILPPEGCNAT